MAEATCAEKLADARTKLHQLLAGTSIVSVGFGERQVQYRNYATDIDRLKQYIYELEGECGDVADTKRRKPFRMVW